jgi:hypothetical protein
VRTIGRVPFGAVLSVGLHRGAGFTWIAVGGAVDPASAERSVTMRVVRYDLASPNMFSGPCQFGDAFTTAGTIADLSGDGWPDVVGAATCGYCTSEYHLWASR